MVTNAIESFGAEVEAGQADVSSPRAVVESFRYESIKGLLGGVSSWPVTAVVTQSHSVGQCDIRPDPCRNRPCDLGHFEGMGETSALVISGVDDNLGFAS